MIVAIILPFILQRFARLSVIPTWASPLVLCFAFGIIIGNFIPLEIHIPSVQQCRDISIVIALPLILMTVDAVGWIQQSQQVIRSFALILIASALSIILMSLIFQDYIPEVAKPAGMMAGIHSGGPGSIRCDDHLD